MLLLGVCRSNLQRLTDWTLSADRVISFQIPESANGWPNGSLGLTEPEPLAKSCGSPIG